MRLRVIGVGSGQGDDAVGLAVAERLRAQPLADAVELRACERPGLGLLEALRGADAAVLVDALRSGAAPGSVRVLDAGEIAAGARLSSHELGVGAALALARALGRALPPLRIVGIELGALRGAALSAALEHALGPACAAVEEALGALRGELAERRAQQGGAASAARHAEG